MPAPTTRSRSYVSRRNDTSDKGELSSLSAIVTIGLLGILVCTLVISIGFIATQLSGG
ncbi:hypothetical protein H8B13_15820 [Hymenobacter sp. BT188]|uniref:hypothetical protein n=1 Tax=Hymenobacter sp. BT188 TaxID=2763504 RepID=UPI001651A94B|nr:hypothetical protein [Hymenobacter sp. BT188]MBC6608297.1 hypothetical protein [Hymenobacter sp. BT188]